MKNDCEKYRLELKQKNLRIQELLAYNSACEDTLMDIEVKFDQEIKRVETAIHDWKIIDPKCDTSSMEFYLMELKSFRKRVFK